MVQTDAELLYKLLNQHHERLIAFSKQMLTLAAATLALWAGLGIPEAWTQASRYVTALLVLSVVCGLWKLYEDAMEPLHVAWTVQKLQGDLHNHPAGHADPIAIRRAPRMRSRIALQVQMTSFLLAFALLGWVMITR